MGLLSNLFGRKPTPISKNPEQTDRRRPKLKKGEILPAGEMKQKYGLTIESYKPRPLNPKKCSREVS